MDGVFDVAVRTPDGAAMWRMQAMRVEDGWSLTLKGPAASWVGGGPDCFEALRDLRTVLEPDGLLVGLNGARPNAWSSGMQRDMGEGLVTYLCELGRQVRPDSVNTLDPAPLELVGTLADQDEFHALWLAEREG